MRRGAARFPAAADENLDAALPRAPGQLVGEPALADAGLADEEEETSAACKRIVEPCRELRELGFATDEDAATRLGRGLVGRHDVERRVLTQDRLMELAQRFAGLDSELVDERSARVLVGGERFCLAAER